MTVSGALLKIYKLLSIYRGEEKKILLFFLLQTLLSGVIGILSSGIDPLFLKHKTDSVELLIINYFHLSKGFWQFTDYNNQLIPFLLGSGAIILIILGLIYSGITDRTDQRKIFFITMIVFLLICIAGYFLIAFDQTFKQIPLLYSLLYIWRFVSGVFLLMLFWDVVIMYFDARQAKRLFPILAGGGAVGYAVGSIMAVPLVGFFKLNFLLLFAGAVIFLSLIILFKIRRTFSIVAALRYREKSIGQELREGFRIFKTNSFLKTLAFSTIIFGIASGLIMFTYNSIVNNMFESRIAATNLMAFQRAVATIFQAVIVTIIMSQSKLGGKMRSGFIIKIAALGLGLAAFLISMVGVADFTRQIAIALLSPAAMASLAILPSVYRGRAMSLNTLVFAPVGMAVASVVVFILNDVVSLNFFIYMIVFLLIIRLIMNLFVNRSYLKLISFNLSKESKFNIASFINEKDLPRKPAILEQLIKAVNKEEKTVKFYLWRSIVSHITTGEAFENIEKYLPREDDSEKALFIKLTSEFAFEKYRGVFQEAKSSKVREVRIAAQTAMLKYYKSRELKSEYEKEYNRIYRDILILTKPNAKKCPALEGIEIFFRAKEEKCPDILDSIWDKINSDIKKDILIILSKDTSEMYLPLFYKEALKSENLSLIYSYFKNYDNLDIEILKNLYKSIGDNYRIELMEILGRQTSDKAFDYLFELFFNYADEFICEGLSCWRKSLKRQFIWASEKNQMFYRLSMVLLKSPYTLSLKMYLISKKCEQEVIKTTSCLYTAWQQGKETYRDDYFILIDRMLKKEINGLIKLMLGFAGLNIKNHDNRLLFYNTIKELDYNIVSMQGQILEVIETYMANESANFVSCFIEELSADERILRLKRYTKGFYLSFKSLITVWEGAINKETGELKKELVAHYKVLV